jgi:hypothetical protein
MGVAEIVAAAEIVSSPRYHLEVRRGRILAIKWGMNPNSSSLGVDVTFLLASATMLAAVTPVIGALLRLAATRAGPSRRCRRAGPRSTCVIRTPPA